MPAFSPHDLRHRRALWHLKGRPVVEAAAWLRHSPQEHLKRYAHATLTDRKQARPRPNGDREPPLTGGVIPAVETWRFAGASESRRGLLDETPAKAGVSCLEGLSPPRLSKASESPFFGPVRFGQVFRIWGERRNGGPSALARNKNCFTLRS